MKRIFFVFLGIIMVLQGGRAQDVHFSQFFDAPLNINPALTGHFNGEHRAIANMKNQWGNNDIVFRTYAFSYDMRINRNKRFSQTEYLSLGTMVYADKSGDLDLTTMQANLNLAYHISISYNQTLGAAISGGFGQKSISMIDAQWDDQYDSNSGGFNPALQTLEKNPFNTVLYPDFGAGILYTIRKREFDKNTNNGIKVILGLGAFHVNAPEIKFLSSSQSVSYSPRFSAHGQAFIGMRSTNMVVSPGLFYFSQGQMQEIYLGTAIKYLLKYRSRYTGFINQSSFSIGAYYRYADAAVGYVQIEVDDIALGLSYDINASKLKMQPTFTNGAELSLKYVFAKNNQRKFH